MKQRGRTSAQSAATLTEISERRPPPPSDLNEFQAGVWRSVVGTRPAGWFGPDTYPLLASYCRHVWHAHEIDLLLAARFDPDSDRRGEIPELLKARERESRIMLALARSMRITQQAQIEPRTAARNKSPEPTPPWRNPND